MKKTILVVGLKGGTGKSCISALYSVYNSSFGDTILIDADVDSPNLAEIFNIKEEIKIEPEGIDIVHLDNLDFFSIGLIAKDKAISMRGDSYVQILLDLINYARWSVNTKEATVIIDCPAGASDTFKGVLKAFHNSIVGAIVVITPSAYTDLKRILKILQHYGVPVIGVIENMAYFKCPKCGKEYKFGDDKVPRICIDFGVDYIGMVPLSNEIYDVVTSGVPYVPADLEPMFDLIKKKVGLMEPVGESILNKITKKVSTSAKKLFVKSITSAIIKINKEIDLKEFTKKGFGGNIIEFIVMHESDIVTQVYLKLVDGRLIVVKEPKKVNITIIANMDTLLEIARGRLDLETAYYLGEIEIYGSTATTRTLSFFSEIWKVMSTEIVDKVGPEVVGDETA